MSWLSTLPVPSGLWLGTPSSLGKSLEITALPPVGRIDIRFAFDVASSRPVRSYQGPSPIRSIALTGVPSPPLVTDRNARHCLPPEPGMLRSAIAVQILSAPRRPAPGPVSP